MHTKYFYHYNFVAKYLKPYLDAFQALFKDTHHYYPGAELIIHSLLFAVGNNIFGSYAPRIITNLIYMLLLIYLCSFRPFRCILSTIIYVSFVLNGQYVSVLVIYTNKNVKMRATSQNDCIPLDNYEQYQDELLALDPTH